MRRKSTFERRDGEFISFANTIRSHCTEHVSEWNIDPVRLNRLSTLIASAAEAYQANSDKATRNQIIIKHKQAVFSELKYELSLFADYLVATPSVPDEALAVMELRPRKHVAHQPLPRPVETPVMSVVRRHNEMDVYVAIAEYGHPTQSVTQKFYYGFKLRWRFETETEYRIELSTSLCHTLYFDRADETKRVIMSAAWMNPRMEEGPWSEDISEVVG